MANNGTDFYGSMEWGYVWKYLPVTTVQDYDEFVKLLNTRVVTNVQYRIDYLLKQLPKTLATRQNIERGLEKLREATAGTTWDHIGCTQTGEHVFTCTEAAFEAAFDTTIDVYSR